MATAPIAPHGRHRRKARFQATSRPWSRRRAENGSARLLAAIPSLPRSVLSKLTARLIDRLDELDGDEGFRNRTGGFRAGKRSGGKRPKADN